MPGERRRVTRIRAALRWGEAQVGAHPAAAVARRAAALAIHPLTDGDATRAVDLAREAASMHVAFAALAALIAEPAKQGENLSE